MSISDFIIPLTNTPQTFDITLSGVNYVMTLKWNDLVNPGETGWVLDIADTNSVPLVCNIPLITGANLLDGLDYLGIGGDLFVQTQGSMPDHVPTFDNLGSECQLYFQTSDG